MKLSIIMKVVFFSVFAIIGITNLLAQHASITLKLGNDIEINQISENVFHHVSYGSLPGFGRFGSNGMIMVKGKEALLFDTPVNDSLTNILLSWICDTMKLKLIGFVPNHWHSDCMGGLAALKKRGIKSYANQLTIDITKQKGLPTPDVGFTDSLELHLGESSVICYFLGAAHTKDNIVVWIPSEKVLFAGCMVKSLNSQNLGNTADGDLNAYPATIEKLLKKFHDAKVIIPGHGEIGGIELIENTLKLATK